MADLSKLTEARSWVAAWREHYAEASRRFVAHRDARHADHLADAVRQDQNAAKAGLAGRAMDREHYSALARVARDLAAKVLQEPDYGRAAFLRRVQTTAEAQRANLESMKRARRYHETTLEEYEKAVRVLEQAVAEAAREAA